MPLTIVSVSAVAWLFGALLEQMGHERAAHLAFFISLIIGIIPVLSRMLDNLRCRYFLTIETLMLSACIGALFLQAYSEAAAVVTLFALGEIMEQMATRKAQKSIAALKKLQPETARLLEGDSERVVPVESLVPGQTIRVIAGERIPLDARVLSGSADIDESLITGESLPKSSAIDEKVLGGTLLLDGELQLQVTTTIGESTVAKIQRLIKEAEENRSETERIITKFSRYYTPAIALLALLVASLPLLGAPGEPRLWIYRALSLLLIGCPCALVISTPTAVTSALAVGARMGLLIKGGLALENFAIIRTIAFDKTGTITKGRPELVRILPLNGQSEEELLLVAASVERASNHPIARSLLAEAAERGIVLRPVANPKIIPGRGLSALFEERKIELIVYRKGKMNPAPSPELARECDSLATEGCTPIVVIDDSNPVGLLAFSDTLRPDAKRVIHSLGTMEIGSIMLTGDIHSTAERIAGELGIEFRSELLPEEKEMLVDELDRKSPTAMVGDGINDAPAMARATVSLAMGGGTEVALDTADAAIVGDSLWGIVNLTRLARATRRNIMQNIAIAMGLKALFLLGAVTGNVTLWMAVFADTGATVLVTLNALRILRFKGSNG